MHDQIVGGVVGSRDFLDLLQRIYFLLNQERAVVVLKQNRAGFARQPVDHSNLSIESHLRHSVYYSLSISRAAARTTSRVTSMSARVVRKLITQARKANLPRNIAFE